MSELSAWCFEGADTKLMQNSGATAFKRTSVDRLMNVLVLCVSLIHQKTTRGQPGRSVQPGESLARNTEVHSPFLVLFNSFLGWPR